MGAKNNFWTSVLKAGDVVGKIGALITLPAALFAGYAFSSEILDFITPPDIDASIKRATLRCNYVWRDPKAFRRFQNGENEILNNLCDDSNLSISFEIKITNNDSIERELQSFSVLVKMWGLGTLDLNEIQSVEHLIQHGVETNIRKDWRVQNIPAGATLIFEIFALPDNKKSEFRWSKFKQEMKDGGALRYKYDDAPEHFARFNISTNIKTNGTFQDTVYLKSCYLKIDNNELEEWDQKSDDERRQLTDDCSDEL